MTGAAKPATAAKIGVTHHAAESRSPTPSLPRRDAPKANTTPTIAVRPNGVVACVSKKTPPTTAAQSERFVKPARPNAKGQSHTSMKTTPSIRHVEKTESCTPTTNIVTMVTGINARVTSTAPTTRPRGTRDCAGPRVDAATSYTSPRQASV